MSVAASLSRPRPLILLEQAGRSDEARTAAEWRRYVESGVLDREAVRPHVARAWMRSTTGGCDPRLMRANVLDAAGTKALLATEAPLIAAARPFSDALSRAAGRDRHAVMLGDRDGRVIDVVGDEASVRGPESVPGPGSLLDEPSAGANGIGTPLAEDGYVEVVGPEHFIEGFHPFTCQGIPLLDGEGQTAGVLSISVRRLGTADRLRDILFCGAHGVECELLSRSLTTAATSVSATGRGEPLGDELAERLRQDLVQRLAIAQLRLESAALHAARGGSVTELLERSEVLIQRFRRTAEIWRDLVIEHPRTPGPVPAHALVADLMDLLTTEARMADIRFEWGEDRSLTVLDDRQALARAVLGRFLTAMQTAGAGGTVRVDLATDREGARAVVRLTATPLGGVSLAPLDLPLGRPSP